MNSHYFIGKIKHIYNTQSNLRLYLKDFKQNILKYSSYKFKVFTLNKIEEIKRQKSIIKTKYWK